MSLVSRRRSWSRPHPRQYVLDDVLADLRAAGLGRRLRRSSSQTVALPGPVNRAATALERSGPLARLALRFRFTYLVVASRG
jgi:hypothetical protein